MDKIIIKIGYESYVTDLTESAFGIVKTLKELTPVKSEYINGKNLYFPSEEGNKLKLEVEFINEDQFRKPTKAEAENKEISDLKSSLKYKEGLLETEKAAKKAVECELELLKKETVSDKPQPEQF